MKILWAPNPLNTVVELDGADKATLRHKVYIEELENRIVLACTDISPDGRTYLKKMGKGKPLKEHVADVIEMMIADVEAKVERQTAAAIAAMTESHHGDCIRECHTCTKCWAESLLGVDTLEGLHGDASYFPEAFEEGRGLPEAIAYLAAYYPKPSGSWVTSTRRTDFDVHVPRWREEAAKAHTWLVAYASQGSSGIIVEAPSPAEKAAIEERFGMTRPEILDSPAFPHPTKKGSP